MRLKAWNVYCLIKDVTKKLDDLLPDFLLNILLRQPEEAVLALEGLVERLKKAEIALEIVKTSMILNGLDKTMPKEYRKVCLSLTEIKEMK